ncbi:MAG: aminoacyl-tRNA deacylase [Porticoccaceae bacterium]
MAMAMTMKAFLNSRDVDFEEIKHPREVTASRIAQRAHVTGEQLAKAVLVKGDTGYRVVVVPSTCRVDLSGLSHQFHERLGLATEEEIYQLFADCDAGALSPLGQAYGLRVCYDETLANQDDIYFEGGDHETLVHMSNNEFRRLMSEALPGRFSHHM